jgi:hypothetical protein
MRGFPANGSPIAIAWPAGHCFWPDGGSCVAEVVGQCYSEERGKYRYYDLRFQGLFGSAFSFRQQKIYSLQPTASLHQDTFSITFLLLQKAVCSFKKRTRSQPIQEE